MDTTLLTSVGASMLGRITVSLRGLARSVSSPEAKRVMNGEGVTALVIKQIWPVPSCARALCVSEGSSRWSWLRELGCLDIEHIWPRRSSFRSLFAWRVRDGALALAFPSAVDGSGRNGLRAEAGRTPYYQDQLNLSALAVTLPGRIEEWDSSASVE